MFRLEVGLCGAATVSSSVIQSTMKSPMFVLMVLYGPAPHDLRAPVVNVVALVPAASLAGVAGVAYTVGFAVRMKTVAPPPAPPVV